KPSRPGICTSRKTRSGACSLIKLTASTPFLPCATTCTSSSDFSRYASSSRASCSSSTMRAERGMVLLFYSSPERSQGSSSLQDVEWFHASLGIFLIKAERKSSQILESHRHAHAAAHAQRGEAAPGFAPAHLVQQRRHNARPRAANGMPQRNGAAVHVQLLAIHVQLAVARYHLRRKSFVQFDNIKLL